MIFDDISFHDSTILEVVEHSKEQTLDFLLDFYVDWENHKSEKRVLRFKDAIVYIKKEIPFLGSPSILDIKQLNSHKHTYKDLTGSINTSKHKIEIVTNAGSRFIEFSDVELLNA
jgi:hypothetical protein